MATPSPKMALTQKAGRDSLPLAPSRLPAQAPLTPKKAAFRPPPPLQPPFREELPTAPVAKAPAVDAKNEKVRCRPSSMALGRRISIWKRLAERFLDETVGKKTETGMTLVAAMIAIAEMTRDRRDDRDRGRKKLAT